MTATNGVGAGPPSPASDVAVAPFDSLTAFAARHVTDFQGRGATPAEVVLEVSALASGADPTADVLAQRRSVDAVTNVDPVARLYLAYFLRPPDAEGLAYWTHQKRAGRPLGAISAYFAASNEFRERYGTLSDWSFVGLLYQNVFHRAADLGGQQYWRDRLARGMTRGQLLIGFSESTEARTTMGPTVDLAVMWSPCWGRLRLRTR